MRKLIAAFIAVVVFAFLLSACGGNSSTKDSSTKKVAHHPYNVDAYWIHAGNTAPFANALATSDGELFWNATRSADFEVYPAGVSLKLGTSAELVHATLMYSTDGQLKERRFLSWNGKRLAPMTKTMRTYGGQKRQFKLRKVDALVYDSRFSAN